MLRAVAEVNLAAIERNVTRLQAGLTAGTRLCAVVKADGYGHGAVTVARAALAAGATMLAVVTAREAEELRAAGIRAPVLVMGALSHEELPVALAAEAELVAWEVRFIDDLHRMIGRRAPRRAPVGIHVKLDSGLGRLGTRDPGQALAVARAVLDGAPSMRLAGVMTHFATADCDLDFVSEQLERFRPFAGAIRCLANGEPLLVHAANSAAALKVPASHFDLVRTGIAIYGGDPGNQDPAEHGLEPALSWRSYAAAVKAVAPGESAGYGRRFIAQRDSFIATVPVGYADGYSRGLTNRGRVLIGGRSYPVVGTVSMDNITIDLGPDPRVEVGEPVTLLGRDGESAVTAEEMASSLDTINYEVFCRISGRVPRRYHRDGVPV